MPRLLRDMVVVITGASAGIGRELAVQLAHAGAKLALAARRVDRLNELNASLAGSHLVVACDVARRADCERLIHAARDHFGRIDTLVCNAGYGIARSIADTSADEIQAMFQTNVFGTTDCIRAAVPVMRSQSPRGQWRGQIVIVSSAAGRRGLPFFGAYSATKSAQLSIAEALRVELKPHRIAATSVHPIGTATEFHDATERMTNLKLPPPRRGEIRQSPVIVARAIVRAIRSPRPEVWPMAGARYLLTLAAAWPSLGDRLLKDYRAELDPNR